jgi:hemophore-related protein
MSTAVLVARRAAAAVLGAGAVFIAGAATAVADPAPGCTAGDITAVEGQVATALSAYFFTHPDVNAFFSGVQGLAKADAASQTKAYLAANPQVKDAISGIRGPVFDLRSRCGIPTNNIIRGVL